MFENFSPFQLIITGVFAFFAVAGMIFFAVYQAGSRQNIEINIYSELNSPHLNTVIEWASQANDFQINLVTIAPEQFVDTVIERLSLGVVPDLLIMEADKQHELGQRLTALPSGSLPLAALRDTFVIGSESAFNMSGALRAYPLFVDPLLLYTNESALLSAGISRIPISWGEFSEVVTNVSRRQGSTLNTSVTALGTYSNIEHATDIISAMLLQTGAALATLDQSGRFIVDIPTTNMQNVVSYYTNFANPQSAVYTWNQQQPNSFTAFTSNQTNMAFGFTSDVPSVQRRNPNLSFRVTEIPQIEGSPKVTYAKFYGIFPVAASRNRDLALTTLVTALNDNETLQTIADELSLSPAKRSALRINADEDARQASDRSALYATTWPNPQSDQYEQIIQEMIEQISLSGATVSSSVGQAISRLNNLLR